jgi:hypothetical protein
MSEAYIYPSSPTKVAPSRMVENDITALFWPDGYHNIIELSDAIRYLEVIRNKRKQQQRWWCSMIEIH